MYSTIRKMLERGCQDSLYAMERSVWARPVPNTNSEADYLAPNFWAPRCLQVCPIQILKSVWRRLRMENLHGENNENR